jgi:HEAT repeat protein
VAGQIVDLNGLDLKGDETDHEEFRSRLRALLAEATSPEAKCVVLRKLAELHNLADVPVLIEALRDPNPDVHCAANEALRFLSRKLSAPRLFEDDDTATHKAVIAYWEKWHESLVSDD